MIKVKQLGQFANNVGTLTPSDFVLADTKSEDYDGYLINHKGNGWQHDHKQAYTKFILELYENNDRVQQSGLRNG